MYIESKPKHLGRTSGNINLVHARPFYKRAAYYPRVRTIVIGTNCVHYRLRIFESVTRITYMFNIHPHPDRGRDEHEIPKKVI